MPAEAVQTARATETRSPIVSPVRSVIATRWSCPPRSDPSAAGGPAGGEWHAGARGGGAGGPPAALVADGDAHPPWTSPPPLRNQTHRAVLQHLEVTFDPLAARSSALATTSPSEPVTPHAHR